jgi:hypothetical protein
MLLTTPPITSPPESFFQGFPERDRDAARQFYKKHLELQGLSVAAAGEVSDAALERTYYIVSHMLAGRPDVLHAMATNGTRLIIIGKDQLYTDMPEYRDSPNPAYLERARPWHRRLSGHQLWRGEFAQSPAGSLRRRKHQRA